MKWIILLFPCIAFASGSHHDQSVANTTFNTTISHNSTYKVVKKPSGVALGIASSQLSFDAGTIKNQVGVGIGSFEGSHAIVFGAGKAFDDMMINGTIGKEDGKIGLGVGIMSQF